MLCYRCGHNVPDRALRCSNCGAELGSATRAMKIPRGSIKALRQRRSEAEEGEIPYKSGDLIAGRYEVQETLGKGPFGVVFKTFDQELESEVAVKVCAGAWLAGDDARERFEGALRQARRLSQQNIVRLYDSGFDRNHAFVAMQFLEGLNLRKILKLREDKGEPFTLPEIEPLLQQMTRALSYCHRTGFHGDIKPENVVLLPERLKITDFFICEGVGAEVFKSARHGSVYVAPEVRQDPASAGARSDIYSVAVIVAELLGGRAFEGELVLPCANHKELPVGVDAIIARATAADPADRHATLEDFSLDLLSAQQTTEAMEPLSRQDDATEVAVMEIEDDPFQPVDTAIYKVGKATPDASFDPLDIPTSMDIGEGPQEARTARSEHTDGAIILDFDDAMEIFEDDDLNTAAMPPLERPAPAAIVQAPISSLSPLVDQDELETTEQPREEIAAPAAPAASPALKKPIMKPVENTAQLPRVVPPEGAPRNTARVKSLPPTKPRGQSVGAPSHNKLTLALAILSIFLLMGVGLFVFYSVEKSRRSSEVVQNFGASSQITPEAPSSP